MDIKPIRSEKDYDKALRRVEALWNSAANSSQGDELEVLVTLIEAYEREHYPVDLPNPLEAIKFRLEQLGEDLRALVGIIGQRTRVYEVMRGARPLSLKMIRNLHQELRIPAEVLIQPGHVKPVKRRQSRSASHTRTSSIKGRKTKRGSDEFKQLAGQGDSGGWRFNRDELHERR